MNENAAPQDRREDPGLRRYSRGEVRADAAAHVCGLVFGPVATVALLITAAKQGQGSLVFASALYGFGLLAMLICSAACNLWPPSRTRDIWRRLDHAVIFLMIAGTYSPLLFIRAATDWASGLLTWVWALAILGAGLKLANPDRWKGIAVVLYLGLGWSILVTIVPFRQSVSPENFILIVTGGLIYSVGVVFHLWERLPYQNAIWHWLVLSGVICHYIAVLDEVAVAAS